jgi:hypothetical protein
MEETERGCLNTSLVEQSLLVSYIMQYLIGRCVNLIRRCVNLIRRCVNLIRRCVNLIRRCVNLTGRCVNTFVYLYTLRILHSADTVVMLKNRASATRSFSASNHNSSQ